MDFCDQYLRNKTTTEWGDARRRRASLVRSLTRASQVLKMASHSQPLSNTSTPGTIYGEQSLAKTRRDPRRRNAAPVAVDLRKNNITSNTTIHASPTCRDTLLAQSRASLKEDRCQWSIRSLIIPNVGDHWRLASSEMRRILPTWYTELIATIFSVSGEAYGAAVSIDSTSLAQ